MTSTECSEILEAIKNVKLASESLDDELFILETLLENQPQTI